METNHDRQPKLFENIRDLIQLVVQPDFPFSRTSDSPGNVTKLSSAANFDHDVNLFAGVDLMEYFQKQWSDIQTETKRNAKLARDTERHSVDIFVNSIKKSAEKLDQDLASIPAQLAAVEQEMERSMALLGRLEDAITELEQIKIAHSFEKRKEESKRKLDQMMIRRAEDLALYESQVSSRHQEHETRMLLERQLVFQQAFEEELRLYKEKGDIDRIIVTEVPKLEDISLDIGEAEANELEKFLEDDQ